MMKGDVESKKVAVSSQHHGIAIIFKKKWMKYLGGDMYSENILRIHATELDGKPALVITRV